MPKDEADDASTTPVIEFAGVHLFAPPPRPRRWRPRRPSEPVRLLDDVSFTIAPGEAVGLISPTGAGSSSALMELIAGVVRPAAGTVRTGGLAPDAEPEQLSHKIGLLSGHQPQLLPHLSLYDSLQLLAEAHQLPDPQWRARRGELVRRLELASFLALPTGRLAPGRRRRAELAAALIHDPELLILDEPTLGLDVVNREQIRTFLAEENRTAGRTLLLSTDSLGDLEQVCTRVLAVDGGKLVHDGDLSELISRAGAERTLVVELTEADQVLDDIPGAKLIAVEAGGLRQRLTFSSGEVPSSRILAAVAARDGIRNLTLEEPVPADLIRNL